MPDAGDLDPPYRREPQLRESVRAPYGYYWASFQEQEDAACLRRIFREAADLKRRESGRLTLGSRIKLARRIFAW